MGYITFKKAEHLCYTWRYTQCLLLSKSLSTRSATIEYSHSHTRYQNNKVTLATVCGTEDRRVSNRGRNFLLRRHVRGGSRLRLVSYPIDTRGYVSGKTNTALLSSLGLRMCEV
jgi:hypothetical protein